MINSILVITPNYPIEGDPVYPFVKIICEEFAKRGIRISVLSPQSLTSAFLHRKRLRPTYREEEIAGNTISIYQPYCITPFHRFLKAYNFSIRLSALFFLKKHNINLDVCYCHFWCSAFFVMPFMKRHNIPMIVASGESQINTLLSPNKKYPDFNEFVKGVVCVSSKNKEESVKLCYTTADKCVVLPNAVNSALFHKREREVCRNQLGLPLDAFIVAFVGWFIERKGPRRVAAAISKVGGCNSIFIGKGEQVPQCEGILFKGSLPHDEVPLYLGAADVFVLPTQHEGCCNAVVEAMACGLPIISSNLSFNWDVLDESNSIMIDPNNVDEIANAIKMLRDNKEMREQLAEGALKKAESLTIEKRANAIIDFIESKI